MRARKRGQRQVYISEMTLTSLGRYVERDEAHLLGAATRADRTLWYASKVPEELLARPWGELEYLEEFRVERSTRKNHCLHHCEVPSSDAGTLTDYLGRDVALDYTRG